MKVGKSLNVLLLILLTLPFFGGFAILNIQKQAIKKQTKKQIIAGIPKTEQTLFFFPANSPYSFVQQHKDNFEYKGNIYVVIAYEKVEDNILITCWLNKAESSLNRVLSNLVNLTISTNPKNNQGKELLMSFVKNLYCQNKLQYNFNNLSHSKRLFSYFHNYKNIILTLDSPPPQLV